MPYDYILMDLAHRVLAIKKELSMFHSETIVEAFNVGGSADIEVIALEAALSADHPKPRSPAFAVQAIFNIAASHKKNVGEVLTRDDFLVEFSTLKSEVYKGLLSWDSENSCWSLGEGPAIDASRIQQDALRWYLNGWDFSRHTRDDKFRYPEDNKLGLSGEGIDPLFNAMMPLDDELTRRIFVEQGTKRIGYCDVFKSDEPELYVAELGFFSDRRTHSLQFGKQPFWQLEGISVPVLLSQHRVLCYRVHHISARRNILK